MKLYARFIRWLDHSPAFDALRGVQRVRGKCSMHIKMPCHRLIVEDGGLAICKSSGRIETAVLQGSGKIYVGAIEWATIPGGAGAGAGYAGRSILQ